MLWKAIKKWDGWLFSQQQKGWIWQEKKKKAKVTKPQNVNTVRFNIPDDHKQARLNSGNNRSE